MLKNLTTSRLMIVILFVLLFAISVRIPVDTDTWWHLRSGEYILTQRQVPLTDPFSWTRAGQSWIDQSWGAQIVMYSVYRLTGGDGSPGTGSVGLAFYTAILATGGMAFIYLMCEGNPYLRGFVCVLTASAAAVFWSARPQMISFFLSTVILYLIYLYKRKHVDRLWLIPIIMVLWVNLHAGFSVGFIFLFGTVIGESIGRIIDGKNPDLLSWQQIGKLLLVSVIGYAVLVINPNTIQMWTYSLRTVNINFLQQFIQEWNSPDFHRRETWPFIFLLLGILAFAGLTQRRIGWSDLVLVCGTAFLSLQAGRNISVFAVVAGPVLSQQANAWLEERGARILPSRKPRGVMITVNWLLLGLVVLGAGLYILSTLNPKAVIAAKKDFLPIDATAYLADHPDLAGLRMFNSYNWGGYLMFAAPSYPVYVDGRTDLYDDQILFEWLHTIQGQDWQKTFADRGIKLAVIEHDSALAVLLRQQSNWAEVYSDFDASIFKAQ